MCPIPCLGEVLAEAFNLGYQVSVSEDVDSLFFFNSKGEFRLSTLNGNSHVAESHDVYIHVHSRNGGNGQEQHLDRLKLAKIAGFQLLIATVNNDNAIEIHILKKNGWTQTPLKSHYSLWTKEL